MELRISLFVPYFRPAEDARRRELEVCLEKNRENARIDHIYLMIDDDAEVDVADHRVTVLRMNRRPTYKDWADLTEQHCPNDVSVLANADIYFDSTVSKLKELFTADPSGFVALSRYELIGGETSLHPNPHWSQDVWAYYPARASNRDRDQRLNFPLGVPRCDNKVAYVFSVYGHAVYNPCREVRSIHVHETGLRNYDKKGDMRIVGGMAMVHASVSLLEPAPLDIEIWPVKAANFGAVKLNKSLEKWSVERGMTMPPVRAPEKATAKPLAAVLEGPAGEYFQDRNIVGFDKHWQFPAITEQHAFNQVRLLACRDTETSYIGFPWATLIDVSIHNQSDHLRLGALRAGLDFTARTAAGHRKVVTVCQHIHMLKFPDLFRRAGVTDIFWSHAAKGELAFPGAPDIKIHPFPLYPVQVAKTEAIPYEQRRYLFSFVGAKANSKYLTQSRTYIVEELAGDPRGLIRDRDAWHYNAVVYDNQVLARAKPGAALIDEAASEEFRSIMAQSVFSLCPSGTGPNSIRLWESIAGGTIPVVLADTYRPPAAPDLWHQAVVTCEETREAIRALPDRLAAVLADREGLRRRRFALSMLAQRFNKQNFVPDVLALLSGEGRRSYSYNHEA